MITRTRNGLFTGMIGAALVGALALGLNIGSAPAGASSIQAAGSTLPPPQSTSTVPKPVSVFHTQGETEYARSIWSNSAGYTYVQVGRSSYNGNRQTWLDLYTYDYNSGAFNCVFGMIPDTSLTGSANSNLTLDVDTSTLTNAYTCGNGGGPLHLTFHQSNAYSTRGTSTGETQYGTTFTMRHSGTTEETSATLEGTVFGQAAPSGTFGSMGLGHNSDLQIWRQP